MIFKHSHRNILLLFIALWISSLSQINAQGHRTGSGVSLGAWVSDNGDGTYTNPVLHADYSDPDAIRVDSTYYMTASSFNCVPGLPLLCSHDLVNWELKGYALHKLPPYDLYSTMQHGCGVWAPCIRYHNNEFYIIYPDPDYGIYMVKAPAIDGPWSEPVLIKEGKGMIDPSPLWDDNGTAWLVYAFAGTRAGTKSVLMVCSMTPDATKANDDDVMVFDGHLDNKTVEGPKFYKRNGWYYIFAPAGGVPLGWQLVMRSHNVTGPYEVKKVMAQGKSPINGPHQGAWVTTVTGEDWFLNFQDKEAYGRVVHLNPMKWVNDWPVIGTDKDGDGCGEPVSSYKKPDVGKNYPVMTPPESDDFNTSATGLQWQWLANKHLTWGYPSGNLGYYRLNCIAKPGGYKNMWDAPNLLLQKFPAEEFTATCKLSFTPNFDLEETGMVIMGMDYAGISVRQEEGQLYLSYIECKAADKGGEELRSDKIPLKTNTIYLRFKVKKGALCTFTWSTDGKSFRQTGNEFAAKPGRWIGAKIGFFALREGFINDAGFVNIDWFRVEK
ncbi:MAG TPA: glycoside hydrolase 43 family protein [Bacteroidales bacterium]|nr:glycoside hydrolase 43 family protein [Bacteroidales bacterium]HPT11331.1 glycoside hydrolase 43 family protein [Bacteroidales bacterium]